MRYFCFCSTRLYRFSESPWGVLTLLGVIPRALGGQKSVRHRDVAGLSRRTGLDRGMLGVVGVKVRNPRQAAGLLRGKFERATRLAGLVRWAREPPARTMIFERGAVGCLLGWRSGSS